MIVALLVLIVGCSQQPDININEVLTKSEDLLRESDRIETTASAFDGDVKFRLMVEEEPTEEEAIILFNKILDAVIYYSNRVDVWDYYDGYFDIKTYDHNGVVYEGIKLIGEDLETVSK